MYVCLAIQDNITVDIIDERNCRVTLKRFQDVFSYYRYPKDVTIRDKGLDLIYWQGDHWNYIINLPEKLQRDQELIITKDDVKIVFNSDDGKIDWAECFEGVTTYTFHDDLE